MVMALVREGNMAIIHTTVERAADGTERILSRQRVHRDNECRADALAGRRHLGAVAESNWSRWSDAPDPLDPRYAEAARRTGEIVAMVIARST